MTQRDNYRDIVGAQAIFQPAINPDQPTATGPILLKWRGVWAEQTLYNKNDLVKTPTVFDADGLVLSSATLEIALETHVSSLQFVDDEDFWGRVLDASELQGSGVPPDELQAFVTQAQTYANAANSFATNASCFAAKAQTVADGMTTNINDAFDQIDTSIGEAESLRDDAATYAAQAGSYVQDANDAVSLADDAAQQALGYLTITALQPYMYIDDPAGSGSFDVSPDRTWIGKKVVWRNATRACRLVLSPNWNRSPWIDGSDAAAWFRGKRVGAAALSIVSGANAIVAPDFIVDEHFSARQTAVVGTTTVLRSVVVPAGTDRWIVEQSFSLYNTADTGRSHTVTAQVRGGATFTMTKLQGPLTTNQYNLNGAQIVGTMWVGNIPDSASVAQTIDVTTVYPTQVFLYDQYIFVAGPSGGYNTTTVGFSESISSAAFVDIALTVSTGKANSLAVLGMAQRQSAKPSTLSPGVKRFSEQVQPVDPTGSFNNSSIFGYEKSLTVGAKSWRGTWGAAGRHAALGVLLEPGVSAGAVVLRADPGITLATITAGQEFLVEGLNDGLTYDIT